MEKLYTPVNLIRRYIMVLMIITTVISCSDNRGTVNIGLQTRLLASESDILKADDQLNQVFKKYLELSDYTNYPGKTFILFDTVFTSTLDHFPVKSKAVFLPESASFIEGKSMEDGLQSILLKNRNRYVYRTIVPEQDFKQFILIDIVSPDSLKIHNYFSLQKIKELIVR